MVLYNVADCAHFLVKCATTLHAKILGHCDLHTLDMIAVPDRLQKGISKSEKHHVVNGRFAEIMVDPEDVSLPKSLQQNGVELDCRIQVAPEWLLDDYPGSASAIGLSELLDYRAEYGWRNRQVMGRMLGVAELLAKRLER